MRTKTRAVSYLVAVVLVIAILSGTILSARCFLHREVVVATVTDKTVKAYNGEDKYLVFVDVQGGKSTTYEIEDTLVGFRFNSSDVYSALKSGRTYKLEIMGYRIPYLSMYPNILSYEEVE
jgi:hypothetical protein